MPAPPGPDATAPQLLLAAAQQAAKPASTGRYWRVLMVDKSSGQNLKGRAGAETFDIGMRFAEEVWLPKNPADGYWVGSQSLGVFPWSAKDKAAWARAGSPTRFTGFLDPPTGARTTTLSTKPRPGKLQQVDAGWRVEVYNLYDPFDLAKLPADPDALRSAAVEKMKETGRAEDGDLGIYVMMTELLKFAPATPELRSAAFTVLSRLPEIRNLGMREDAAGRTGIALGWGSSHYMILNPQDYSFLGYGFLDADQDRSIIKLGWTDDKPVAPALN
ncbi:hypothetical protein AB0M20_45445 [Actinoplanes sp. NPDC051633]|uniref:hypothetical protein n=1 Tax=Actinoplanes sp. NPDC051633 TaxID=3155670 RepID=UPI00342EE30C